ncbi:RNA polymerase sigma factor [Clostridium sp. CX1]|nr:RNA polymerase sigma factor [Clostridium sp. CX1]MCT8975279.1 RNA polymerase sigma factor [Clostridium sp. CX1]
MRILINNCKDFIKSSKKVVSIDEVVLQSSKCEEFEQIELREIFNSLDGSLRLIVQLYYIEDISVKDIAKLTNIPEGTVKSRLHRARRILNELFTDRRTSYAGNVK